MSTQDNAIEVIESNTSNTVLDDLLEQLGDDTVIEAIGTTTDDAVIEGDLGAQIIAATGVEGAALDSLLDDVLVDVGNADVKSELYAAQENLSDSAPAAAEAAPEVTEPAKGKGKGKGKGAGKGGKKAKTTVPPGYGSDAAGEGEKQPAAAAAPAEPKPPKPPRVSSVTHKPGDLLLAKLGSDAAANWLIFDTNHDGEQIQAAHADFIAKMNLRSNEPGGIADKVQDKISMFIMWLAKGGTLNEVLRRTITLLHKDGKLTSGDKGNLQLDLLAKPYSIGTARSQANQMFMALPELKLTIKEKGVMVPNPDSPLLAAAYAQLGLA